LPRISAKAVSSSPRRIHPLVTAALQRALRAPTLLLVIMTAAIVLPVLLTSCGKKGQTDEKKTVQKSEDDFLDKNAKPDERKYLLAAKPFFIAVANRKYADAYALLSRYAIARMSLDQFKPSEQDSDPQQSQLYLFDNVTADQFAYLM
jgi:hypothetical protein